jgi:hypothetical protein
MFHADNAKQEFFSRNVTAPQTNTVPVVKISADYDSVPKGSKYIHPDGSVRTKQ